MQKAIARFFSEYGMLAVLLLLCVYYSAATWEEQHPTGAEAGRLLAQEIVARHGDGARVLIAVRGSEEDDAFAAALAAELAEAGAEVVEIVKGEPVAARRALESAARAGLPLHAIAATQATSNWGVFDDLASRYPSLGSPEIVRPEAYAWPNFLKADNLLNIANQIAVIAIIAIGMTMVIITAGIDLSVGSLIALSAVVATSGVVELGGGTEAGALSLTLWSIAGIATCALVGAFTGVMVTAFRIPPFIVTLAMMLVASGLAFIVAEGQSIYQLPDRFIWLGRGADLFGIPNAVLLMLVLYAAAHILMTRTVLGRWIYAVGGNPEAARLSGVPVPLVLLFVYTASGALAGLGGIVTASQLKSGSPTYGVMYELYVIAAVVVGGTSLAGGEGKVLGTLIGAFIIAVIRNGMNLTGVESYTQKVVLGLVILAAVLIDTMKHRGAGILRLWRRRRVHAAAVGENRGAAGSTAPSSDEKPGGREPRR